LPKGIGLHGLRHSLATLLAVSGAQAPEIMVSLGHRQMSTTTRYLHFCRHCPSRLGRTRHCTCAGRLGRRERDPQGRCGCAIAQAQAAVMAKFKEIVGTGITAREVTRYSGEDMFPAFEAFARQWNAALSEGGDQFGAVVFNAERVCRSILANAGPKPFAPDSAEDYARRVLHLIDLTRTDIALGDAAGAGRMAIDIGRLCTEAHMKRVWEKYALRALRNVSNLKLAAARANKKKQRVAKSREADWQGMATDMWAQNRHLSAADIGRRIADKLGGNHNTIRRKIKRK
jgi:Phage integrase family